MGGEYEVMWNETEREGTGETETLTKSRPFHLIDLSVPMPMCVFCPTMSSSYLCALKDIFNPYTIQGGSSGREEKRTVQIASGRTVVGPRRSVTLTPAK